MFHLTHIARASRVPLVLLVSYIMLLSFRVCSPCMVLYLPILFLFDPSLRWTSQVSAQ